jgi:ATP-dependent Lon protease
VVTNNDGKNIEFKNILPLLPIRDLVVYPFMILPLFVGRESSILAVEHALNKTDRLIFLSSQKDITAEYPTPAEIYQMGTIAMIMRMRKLPDGRIKILIQGLSKARINEYVQTEPFFQAKISKVESTESGQHDPSLEAFVRNVREQLEKIIAMGKVLSPDILMVLDDIHDPGRLADLVASNLNLPVSEAQMILETLDPSERLKKISDILNREVEILSMQAKIKTAAKEEISKTQKEFFLREQMKAIKNELGDGEKQDEFQELQDKILAAKMTSEAEKEALKQLARLEKMHPDSSESSITRTYLEWLLDLPWAVSSKEDLDLDRAKKILDEDHFDLEKVKERILEYLAVRRLKGQQTMKGPILCFAGPPGVGKTSLGKSIARATGREFIRMALGGMKDEAEIRGHRRTYVGAMPGRFIQALKQAGTNNPVIMLDEVDKLGNDFRGDPSSALLEVLDPEQNYFFRDHYLNLTFDLSKVMFIATANLIDKVPDPLRDRMEVLQLSGYMQEEKVAIAKKYLIPKQMNECSVTSSNIELADDAIANIIQNYTLEAGLRNLERNIGAVCRKVARKIASGNSSQIVVTSDNLSEFLGPAVFSRNDERKDDECGVATGLAWTSAGGEILSIEASKMKGRGLTLTGQLGDVMKESAQAAIGYIRSHAIDLGIEEDFFEKYEIHVHVPAGATPKDGPSAGITLATAIVSLLTETPISKDVAMTGEVTLTGKVLPIGGLKEKSLAAMRAGIKTIIVPFRNKKDIDDIPEQYRNKLNFILVKNLDEVLEAAILNWKAIREMNTKKLTGKKGKIKDKSSQEPMAA